MNIFLTLFLHLNFLCLLILIRFLFNFKLFLFRIFHFLFWAIWIIKFFLLYFFMLEFLPFFDVHSIFDNHFSVSDHLFKELKLEVPFFISACQNHIVLTPEPLYPSFHRFFDICLDQQITGFPHSTYDWAIFWISRRKMHVISTHFVHTDLFYSRPEIAETAMNSTFLVVWWFYLG